MFKTTEAVKRPLKLFVSFYILAILFGAPLSSDIQATSLLALILTVCTGAPLLIVYKSDNQIFDLLCNFSCTTKSETLTLGAVIGTLIGCFISGFVIPLDWDRPWQKYSFPNCVGAIGGCLIGLLYCFSKTKTMDSSTINDKNNTCTASPTSPISPTPTITPSSSSGSISSHGEGQFGRYRLGDIPKIEAMFFAIFDNTRGSIIKHVVPSDHLRELTKEERERYEIEALRERFGAASVAIIPKIELMNRLVKINFNDIKIMGNPISLEHIDYERGKFIFNMCFVVTKASTVDCMYEPLVQKLAEYLVELEQQHRFLSNEATQAQLPDIMSKILERLNGHGECVVPIKDLKDQLLTTIYLILCPSYRGVEPPKVAPYMVPMLTRNVDVSTNSASIVSKMDVLSQKIMTRIDGVRCVKEIAAEVSIDADLVSRCIRNFYFYECVSLVPLFLYQNCYVSTEKLHNFFFSNPNKISQIEECLKFVKLRFNNKEAEPEPSFHDVFRLYMSLTCGLTMTTWCEKFVPRKYHVDERRLVQYGMHNNFVRKLSIFPVTTVSPDEEKEYTRIHSLCDGTNAIEDLAVLYSVPPDELLKYLRRTSKFEFISK